MALIQVNYLSEALFRTVPLNVILPVDKLSFAEKEYEMKPGIQDALPSSWLSGKLYGLCYQHEDSKVGGREKSGSRHALRRQLILYQQAKRKHELSKVHRRRTAQNHPADVSPFREKGRHLHRRAFHGRLRCDPKRHDLF